MQFGNEPRLTEASLYCSREAIARGIPAVDIECGRLGLVDPEAVAEIKQALHRLLGHLGMMEDKLGRVEQPLLIARRTTISSTHTGFFFHQVKAGEFIHTGQRLGHTTDSFGNQLAEVVAPVSGVVLYMTATPPITKGETLFSIGHTPLTAGP